MPIRFAPAFLFVVLCLTAACSPTAPAEGAEVAAESILSERTEEVAATPEPTETPMPSATPIRRATLPPTWTPTATFTPIPTVPTATPDPAEQFGSGNRPNGSLDACRDFVLDFARNPSLIRPGEDVQVYWKASDGRVFYYEVKLMNSAGAELKMARTLPTVLHYTFDEDLFEPNSVYRWSVTPFDAAADVICQTQTSELRTMLN